MYDFKLMHSWRKNRSFSESNNNFAWSSVDKLQCDASVCFQIKTKVGLTNWANCFILYFLNFFLVILKKSAMLFVFGSLANEQLHEHNSVRVANNGGSTRLAVRLTIFIYSA